MAGEMIPPQVIYTGKRSRCHPHGWHIVVTDKTVVMFSTFDLVHELSENLEPIRGAKVWLFQCVGTPNRRTKLHDGLSK